MKTHFLTIISLAFFFFQACSEIFTEVDLVGKYCSEEEYYFTTLKLENDSTYTFIASVADFMISDYGTWEITENRIVLNSATHLLVPQVIDLKEEITSNDSIIFHFSRAFFQHPELQNLKIDIRGIKYKATQRTAIAKIDLIQEAKIRNINLTYLGVRIHNKAFYVSTYENLLEENEIYISFKENMTLKHFDRIYAAFEIESNKLKSSYSIDEFLSVAELFRCDE